MKYLLLIASFCFVSHSLNAQQITGTWRVKCLSEKQDFGNVKVNSICPKVADNDGGAAVDPVHMIWRQDKIVLVTGKDSMDVFYNMMYERNEVTLVMQGIPTVYKFFNDLEPGRMLMRSEDGTLLYLIEQKKK